MHFRHVFPSPNQLRVSPLVFASLLPALFIPVEPKLLIEDGFKGESPAFLFAIQVVLHLLAFFRLAQRADAESNLSFVDIQVNNLRFYLVSNFKKARRFIYPFGAQLRHMNESFNTLVQAHKNPEIGHTRDLSLDLRTHRKPFSNNFPWISRQLFDTQGEALVFNVYTQHLGFNHVALLIQLRWVLDFLAPMKVRNMNQAIDAFFYAYENAKIRDVSNRSLDNGSDGIFFLSEFPGIGHDLLQSQGNTTMARIYVEDNNFDILSNLKHFGGMGNFSSPRHL